MYANEYQLFCTSSELASRCVDVMQEITVSSGSMRVSSSRVVSTVHVNSVTCLEAINARLVMTDIS